MIIRYSVDNVVETLPFFGDLQELRQYLNADMVEMVYPRGLYSRFKQAYICDKNPGVAVCMVVDEDGRARKKQENLLGTVLYNSSANDIEAPIVGDVVFVGLARESDGGCRFCALDPSVLNDLLYRISAFIRDINS